MKIHELTKPELDMFRELCNFTPKGALRRSLL